MGKSLVEMAADIVQSQSLTTSMTAEEIAVALQVTFKALKDLQQDENLIGQEGAGNDEAVGMVKGKHIPPEKSIQKNKIICLECGQEFKMLSPKHLDSHGLTGRTYRGKYGFKMRQPLCAKSLSAKRKKAGKARGIPENLQKAIDKRRKNNQKKSVK